LNQQDKPIMSYEKLKDKIGDDFLFIAFEEYFNAMLCGNQHNSNYIKKVVYERYEREKRL
jgi:hypothetical protein